MSFRDFITNRWYRRAAAKAMKRLENIKPPANPSRTYLDELVARLLDEAEAPFARKELEMIGAAAAPSLAAALRDRRFLESEDESGDPAALAVVLELLVPHGAAQVMAAVMPLADSPSDERRKEAGLQLASLGRAETIPVLAKLLQDPDGYVRSYVAMGVDRAVSAGRADTVFRQGAYDLLLAQCDQEWEGTLNDAARAVVALDPVRAAADFGSGHWLTIENPNCYCILEACNDERVALPEGVIRSLLERALPATTVARCYPHDRIVMEALRALVLRIGGEARPLVESLLEHQNGELQEAAAGELAKLEGIGNPASFVLDLLEKKRLEKLSHEHRVVYFAFKFDSEVCNGGLMQFFGNGGHAVETVAALRELEHSAAELLVRAMDAVGQGAFKRKQEARMKAFENRYDELQKVFTALERDYRASELRKKWLLYAVKHRRQFGAT